MSATAPRLVYVSDVATEEPRMFADEKDVLTVQDVARLLGVNHKTVRREIARGRLASAKVGACLRITKQQLLDYLKEAGA